MKRKSDYNQSSLSPMSIIAWLKYFVILNVVKDLSHVQKLALAQVKDPSALPQDDIPQVRLAREIIREGRYETQNRN